MYSYDYLIVGGGMSADAAIRGIREMDAGASIGVIAAEYDPPYARPPLSKGLWQGKPEDHIWLDLETQEVTLHLGRRAQTLDPRSRTLHDGQGASYHYGRLLLATGGHPRTLPFDDHGAVVYFRTMEDYRRVRRCSHDGERMVVIGGGFIGAEMAAALAGGGHRVTLVFPGHGIGAGLFPADLSAYLTDYYRDHGVEVLPGERVHAMRREQGRLLLGTAEQGSEHSRELSADCVVAGLGIVPATELADAAGLKVDNGIVVDKALRTSMEGIWAAGDVASCPNHILGTRQRVEHEDQALYSGRLAGRSMAGAEVDCSGHLSTFYSDLFDLGYEAVGKLDARLETFADWTVPYREGVVYYLEQGRVCGVLLWNVWDQVEAARELIAEPSPIYSADLRGRLPR